MVSLVFGDELTSSTSLLQQLVLVTFLCGPIVGLQLLYLVFVTGFIRSGTTSF